MNGRTKVIITFFSLVVLIMGLYFFSGWFSQVTGYFIEDDPDVAFAKCLSKKGVKYYGSDNCPLCKKQENLLGKIAFQEINYIECSNYPADCSNLQRIPAWQINGSTQYGVKTIDELKRLSLCD